MEIITKKISSELQNELDQIFEEAKGSGDLLKRIWQQDLDERKAFWKDQNRNGKGRTRNRWSAITYRIALAISTRSPAAYEALISYQILKLPSVASLKHFTSANKQPTV
ncbi:unnamed protein product [Porites evermanni]|uniref:Uncharacterized protein n=1 Tax=Porites evermanni TaxID=104178 RepID=A0ABN8PX38_9CNID|nr:unnamed protein product [Porites evermanni]